jgi:hypothetical protein
MSLVGKPLIKVQLAVPDGPAKSHKRRSGTLAAKSSRHSTLPKPALGNSYVNRCLSRVEEIHTVNICRHTSPRFIIDDDGTMAPS